MGFFGFGKKDEGVPPDIGKEISEVPEVLVSEEEEDSEEEEEDVLPKSRKKLSKGKGSKKTGKDSGKDSGKSSGRDSVSFAKELQIEKIKAKLEFLDSWIKELQEKFSAVNEKIGELRSSTIKNEKEISEAILISSRAADLVKEVEPEKLAAHYLKLNERFDYLFEKISSNIEYSNLLMQEIKDLKRKSDLFVGTESLLKLNEDTKTTLLDIQKISSKAKVHADKAEQYFIELKGFLAENQRLEEKVSIIDSTCSNLKKEMQGLSLDLSNVIMRKDFDAFSKTMNNKLSNYQFFIEDFSKMGEEHKSFGKIVEATISIAQKNKKDIDEISALLGREEGDKSNKNIEQFSHLLKIIDRLIEDVERLKKSGRESGKSSVEITSDPLKEIAILLSRGKDSLKSGDKEKAKEIYAELDLLYKSISDDYKTKVYGEIVDFYNSLK
ncbi:MAG: hypothetical protein ABIH28_00180 [archaeon]